MNDDPGRDLLIALSLFPFLTPNRTRLLREYFDPLETACNAPSTLLQALLKLKPEQAAEITNPLTPAMQRRVADLRADVVTLRDPAYPQLLREIPDPPLALHVRGDVTLLERPALAIVGSRRASPYAINVAQHLARQLVGSGLVIVSGMASGVDAASHHAALDAGGATIAVLGTGIDVIYPRSNARLLRCIVDHGLVVTEFPPATPPLKEHFPIRNRVISGISYGTVVVEATRRSGSLITARLAAEQNREVFAVPGSIFSAGSEGTHRLVQYGAKLVHDADDVIEELPRRLNLRPARSEAVADPASPLRDVLEALSRDEGVHVDNVTARVGRSPAAVAEALLQLELQGWVRALPGARYVRMK